MENVVQKLRDILNERSRVSEVVLGVIGTAGIISIAVLAPNALQLLKFIKPRQKNKKQDAQFVHYVSAAITRLKKEGCLTYESGEDGVFVRLTSKGRQRLRRYEWRHIRHPIREKWDNKWRVVIFDVQENRRSARGRLRRALQIFGFIHLQHSVWIFPYECEDIITLLKTDQKLWGNIVYMVVERVENDKRLRKIFNLPVQD